MPPEPLCTVGGRVRFSLMSLSSVEADGRLWLTLCSVQLVPRGPPHTRATSTVGGSDIGWCLLCLSVLLYHRVETGWLINDVVNCLRPSWFLVYAFWQRFAIGCHPVGAVSCCYCIWQLCAGGYHQVGAVSCCCCGCVWQCLVVGCYPVGAVSRCCMVVGCWHSKSC